MSNDMRAWHCYNFLPCEGSLLVHAETRNRARTLASKSSWEWPYIEIDAVLADKAQQPFAIRQRVIESNDELPEGAPPFYSDEEL